MKRHSFLSALLFLIIVATPFILACEKPEEEPEKPSLVIEAEQLAQTWANRHHLLSSAASYWPKSWENQYGCEVSYTRNHFSERKWIKLICNVYTDTCKSTDDQWK